MTDVIAYVLLAAFVVAAGVAYGLAFQRRTTAAIRAFKVAIALLVIATAFSLLT